MARIPGSTGAMVLGDKSLEFYRDSLSFCRNRIEKYRSRVFLSRILNRSTIFVCSVEAMREMLGEKSTHFLKDPTDLLTNMYGDTILSANGERGCLLRLSFSSLFAKICNDASSEFITGVIDQCLTRGFPPSLNRVPVYTVFKRMATEISLGLFLNVRVQEQPELFKEISDLCIQHWHGLTSIPMKFPMWQSGYSVAMEAKEKLMRIIKHKLEHENEGFLGQLSALPLPDTGQAPQHLLLFISALVPKAISSMLTSFVLALSGRTEEFRRRQAADPGYVNRVMLEVQRLWPPFVGARRIAERETTLNGYRIPKGHVVMYITHAIHRDPMIFPNPDSFLPDRWGARNAGQEHFLCCFGSGPRNCIGFRLTNIFFKEACLYLANNYDWHVDPANQDLRYKWLPVARPTIAPTVTFTRLPPPPPPPEDPANAEPAGQAGPAEPPNQAGAP